ncbi:ATP-binding protein [Nonomuraea sp. SBT364]|uniref:ATP-binding protein n=1 Tax=Nonomuraea sp. SBT364 TaxID=1580530 RepID=UPI00066A92A3|nr:LuxR family transcriptional regulator [Nonomuraea sp. SBT364]
MLYGRAAEQEALEALLVAAASRRSGAVVIRGEPGIGKSALMDWTASTAARRGLRILRVTGAESETDLAYAGLVQLLWPVQEHIGALPEAQADALRAVLGTGSATGVDRFRNALAVLTLVTELADRQPVLCLVDDAHWVDRATTEALLFTARRLAAEGVVMVFSARTGAFDAAGLAELHLSRLSDAEAARVLAARTLPPALVERIIAESGGNPLALVEFAASPAVQPEPAAPLPVPERLTGLFHAQIAGLTPRTRTMLSLAAAEDRGHLPTLVTAGRALGVDLRDLDGADQAGLVCITTDRVVFRHPMIRNAAYHAVAPSRRLAVHAALADAVDDPDLRARHLSAATTEPRETVAADLAKAAGRAHARGAYASAAQLYERAARLTPDQRRRAVRLAEAAEQALAAGDVDHAETLAIDAGNTAVDGSHRARVARVRATVAFEREAPGRAAALLVDGAAGAGREHAAEMLRLAAGYGWFSGEPGMVHTAAGQLDALGLPDDAATGMALLVEQDYAAGVRRLDRYVRRIRAGDGDPDRIHAIYAATLLGDDEAVLELTAAEIEKYRRQGFIGRLPKILQNRCSALFRAGLHQDAAAVADEAITIARDTGMRRRLDEIEVALAWIAAAEGDEARCRKLVADAADTSRVAAACALSFLDLGLGRDEAALRRLEAAHAGPGHHVTVLTTSMPDLIEAAVRLGAADRAAEPLRRFEAWAHAIRQPWAEAVALRCRALLTGSQELYERAVTLHGKGGRPFERARTELLYGEWLRRDHRAPEAREHLMTALRIFEELRARPWAERSRSELRAAGASAAPARPAGPSLLDRLTPQELQVTRLAAEGHTSREIAARLFLSRRTVEHHLYRAYPKLGVTSRRELARLELSDGGSSS